MASSLLPLLLVSASWISLMALLISPAQAATCTSQKFKNNKLYANCTDLPSLTSYLHWTHNDSNSSLSIAFIATPSKSDGWVAWAINPTGTKMSGAQTLLAYKTKAGTPEVKTYNITSYSIIVPGKLSFDFWDVSLEFSNGTFTIFATVKVPKNAESVNQVWQVGPAFDETTGFPVKHDFAPDSNLKAFGPLSLVASSTTGTTTNTTTGTPPSSTNDATANTTAGGGTAGAMRIGSGGNMGLFTVLLLVLGALIAF